MNESKLQDRLHSPTEGEWPCYVAWDGILKLLRSLEIDSKVSILLAYAALTGQYDNPIPSWFLAPIDSKSKIQSPQDGLQGIQATVFT